MFDCQIPKPRGVRLFAGADPASGRLESATPPLQTLCSVAGNVQWSAAQSSPTIKGWGGDFRPPSPRSGWSMGLRV